MLRTITAALFVTLALTARADTLILNDGSKVEGTIIEENNDTVVMKVKFGQVPYKKNEIKEIVRSSGVGAAAAGNPAGLRDVVVLKNGEENRGLLVSDDGREVVFDLIMSGKSVSKTMLSQTKFQKTEIAEIRKLTDAQRAAARKHLESVEAQAQKDSAAELNIKVESMTWPASKPDETIPAKKVELEHFVIESNTPDEFLKKAAYRLSKVFNAYKQHFGVDRNQTQKVRVLIFNSMKEYYAALGNTIKNPAFYSPDKKLIAAGCDVAGLERQIAEIRDRHKQLEMILEDWKRKLADARAQVAAAVGRAYGQVKSGPQLEAIKAQQRDWQLQVGEIEKQVNQIQAEINTCNRRNDMVFSEYTKMMFATLYHEGFHAFLDNFLFPEGQSQHVPRWLNEGLAQYFEASRLEGSNFVLGQEDRERMVLLRRFKKEKALVPLDKMVSAGQADYIVHEISNLENSTKNYLQAWCLVHMLGEKGRLTSEILRDYVKLLAAKKDPVESLATLSGIATAQLQAALDEKLKYSFEQNAPVGAPPGK